MIILNERKGKEGKWISRSSVSMAGSIAERVKKRRR